MKGVHVYRAGGWIRTSAHLNVISLLHPQRGGLHMVAYCSCLIVGCYTKLTAMCIYGCLQVFLRHVEPAYLLRQAGMEKNITYD